MNGSWLDRNRHIIFVGLLVIALVGAVTVYLRRPRPDPVEILPPAPTATPTSLPTPTPGLVRVYVSGAVVNSDVYFLSPGSIVKDAILAAGGFTPDAAPERINQALELKDQQQIHVPRLNEENPPPPIQDAPATDEDTNISGSDSMLASGERININAATLEQLDMLPGIGPAIGQRIIDYREKNGGFESIEEITQVSGIGEATFAKIKDLITIEGSNP